MRLETCSGRRRRQRRKKISGNRWLGGSVRRRAHLACGRLVGGILTWSALNSLPIVPAQLGDPQRRRHIVTALWQVRGRQKLHLAQNLLVIDGPWPSDDPPEAAKSARGNESDRLSGPNQARFLWNHNVFGKSSRRAIRDTNFSAQCRLGTGAC